MMIDPPIEDLEKKVGNKYLMTNLVAKRAKELEKEIPDIIEHSQDKAITLAAREVMSGKIVSTRTSDKSGNFGTIISTSDDQTNS